MQWIKGLCLFGLSFGIVFCAACFANADAVSFATNPLWISPTHVTEGREVKISTVVMKTDADSARGTITFFADGAQVGSAPFNLSQDVGGAVIGVSFVPSNGTHSISAKISEVVVTKAGKEETVPASGEIAAKEKLTVDPDADRDGVTDSIDADDDNDGVSDSEEIKRGTDPKKKEEAAQASSSVAGASTSVSSVVEKAKGVAGPIGGNVFAATENVREKGKEFFDKKISTQGNVSGFASTTNADFAQNPIGILAMVKNYAYKAGSFIFGNVYAFYLILILFILWLLRKIWKRYSLD